MGFVVALKDQYTMQVLDSADLAPKGTKIFYSPEAMAQSLGAGLMDQIRKQVLGSEVEKSGDALEAARKLWTVLGAGRRLVNLSKRPEQPTDAFGNTREASRIEAVRLNYTPGKEHMKDFFYKKLSKKERECVDHLVKDGRGIWTADELTEVLAEALRPFNSKTPMDKLTDHVRGLLLGSLFLKRVSIQELAKKPEFSK